MVNIWIIDHNLFLNSINIRRWRDRCRSRALDLSNILCCGHGNLLYARLLSLRALLWSSWLISLILLLLLLLETIDVRRWWCCFVWWHVLTIERRLGWEAILRYWRWWLTSCSWLWLLLFDVTEWRLATCCLIRLRDSTWINWNLRRIL